MTWDGPTVNAIGQPGQRPRPLERDTLVTGVDRPAGPWRVRDRDEALRDIERQLQCGSIAIWLVDAREHQTRRRRLELRDDVRVRAPHRAIRALVAVLHDSSSVGDTERPPSCGQRLRGPESSSRSSLAVTARTTSCVPSLAVAREIFGDAFREARITAERRSRAPSIRDLAVERRFGGNRSASCAVYRVGVKCRGRRSVGRGGSNAAMSSVGAGCSGEVALGDGEEDVTNTPRRIAAVPRALVMGTTVLRRRPGPRQGVEYTSPMGQLTARSIAPAPGARESP